MWRSVTAHQAGGRRVAFEAASVAADALEGVAAGAHDVVAESGQADDEAARAWE